MDRQRPVHGWPGRTKGRVRNRVSGKCMPVQSGRRAEISTGEAQRRAEAAHMARREAEPALLIRSTRSYGHPLAVKNIGERREVHVQARLPSASAVLAGATRRRQGGMIVVEDWRAVRMPVRIADGGGEDRLARRRGRPRRRDRSGRDDRADPWPAPGRLAPLAAVCATPAPAGPGSWGRTGPATT